MKTRTMILCALFAALTAVGAFFKIPFALAAISLQFLFTAMAGVLLGAGYGALSQAVYVLIGLVGTENTEKMDVNADGRIAESSSVTITFNQDADVSASLLTDEIRQNIEAEIQDEC